MRDGVVGVRPLLKVALHQDARNIAPWVALITVLSASSVLVYPWIFPDAASRAELAMTVGANPALSLIFGPARDLSTPDGFNAWRAGALGGFFAALMAILIVVRNSRADEDSGRAELFASGVMGRQARLAVAVAMAGLASVALGIVSSTVTILFGGDVAASITLGATFTASGLMFAGVAAIAAQVGSESRTASSIAVTTLGVAFLTRGYIDASSVPDWAIWLTPLGWTQETRPASGNNGWPLLLALAFAVVLIAAALALHARRDFGMGMIPPRPGPARGGAVAGLWGLALRLNRSSLISWTIAFIALGAVFGLLATSVGEVIAQNPAMEQLMAAGGVTQAGLAFEFLVTIVRLVGIIAALSGVQIVMRVYGEEAEYRVEPVLAGSVTRRAYLASNAVVAFAAAAVWMLIGGAVLGLVASSVEPSIGAGDVLRQAAATIPAVWALVALALAAVGARPGARVVGWMGVVAAFALTILGPLFRLWDWILGISPLWHVPNVTAAAPDWSGVGWVWLVALLLTAVGFAGFRRRDVI